jgi:acyl-CoA synthetase (AMP-forming)/AMP-acid ligase II
VVAFSVPGDGTEELVIAVEVSKEREGLADDIRATVSAEFNVSIKDIAMLEKGTLPKTSSGKLQRRRTRMQYLNGTLGRDGSRRMGSSGDKLTIAKHVARSMWSRVKHNVINIGS